MTRWETFKLYWAEVSNYRKNEKIMGYVKYQFDQTMACSEQFVWQLMKRIPPRVRFEQCYPGNLIKTDIIKIPFRIRRLHLGKWQKYVQKYYQKRYAQFDKLSPHCKLIMRSAAGFDQDKIKII